MDNKFKNLLLELMEWDFVVDELVLFMITHPEDREAYEKYVHANEKASRVRAEYEKRYGSLTVNGDIPVKYPMEWIETPWPWELEF